jgi:hypothetical protein
MANGRQSPPRVVKRRVGEMSVNELILAYASFADSYYRKNGVPTGEFDATRYSLRPLRRLYGDLGVSDFGPLALKAVSDPPNTRGMLALLAMAFPQQMLRMFARPQWLPIPQSIYRQRR